MDRRKEMCGCVTAVFTELNSLSTTGFWGINLFKHQTCAQVSHQHQAGLNFGKYPTKDRRWSLLWVLCETALQLQLHKETLPIWSHILPQVLAMNWFYHSQSHGGKKKTLMCLLKSCCLTSSWSGWSSRQLRGGCHWTHRDGFSPFLGSTSLILTGLTPRMKHSTLEQLPLGAAAGSGAKLTGSSAGSVLPEVLGDGFQPWKTPWPSGIIPWDHHHHASCQFCPLATSYDNETRLSQDPPVLRTWSYSCHWQTWSIQRFQGQNTEEKSELRALCTAQDFPILLQCLSGSLTKLWS